MRLPHNLNKPGLPLRVTGALLLAAYAALRLWALPRMMTHVDDIGPLVELLKAPQAGLHATWLRLRVWTYAPGAWAFTGPLVALARSPQQVLFAGRVVSLAAWALGLGLLAGLLRDLNRATQGRVAAGAGSMALLWGLL